VTHNQIAVTHLSKLVTHHEMRVPGIRLAMTHRRMAVTPSLKAATPGRLAATYCGLEEAPGGRVVTQRPGVRLTTPDLLAASPGCDARSAGFVAKGGHGAWHVSSHAGTASPEGGRL
jgi:hypothetical protein